MTEEPRPSFSKWRALLWPVHRHELGKIIPMFIMFFFISLNYNILRCIKDSLIITAKGSGAEAIPFIKVWAMFPASILFTWIYLKLTKYLRREVVFYIILAIFVGFFALFGFVFFPMREQFHLHGFADWLSHHLPLGCHGLISMICYWSFTLFYVMSELWGNIVLMVLAWGFVNQVTKFEEARRFYAILSIGINLSGIFSGNLSIDIAQYAAARGGSWDISLTYLMALVTISGVMAALTFFYLNRYITARPHYFIEEKKASPTLPGEKPRMSFRKSIGCILSSKYMLCLMTIVLSYNVIINLVEVLWKHEAKELYPDTQSYTIFMNEVTIYTGIIATLSAALISGNCIRRLGWTFAALMTPLILLVTSIGFFTFFFMKTNALIPSIVGGFTPLAVVVFFGSLQNILSRAAKYSVFDETKEMAYIPLQPEEKIKGKAAIDGVFNRMGKSTGAFIYQALFLIFSTITASAPYVACILIFFLVLWTGAILSLGSQINQLAASKQSLPATT